MSIPGAENVVAQSFEVVPGADSAQLVVQGAGRPAVLVISFSKTQAFEATGKMFAAADHLDHGQVVAVLRELSRRVVGEPVNQPVTVPLAVVPDQAQGQAPDQVPDVVLLLEFALELQGCARDAGMSDPVIAALLQSALSIPAGGVAARVTAGRAALGLLLSAPASAAAPAVAPADQESDRAR